MQKSRQFKYSGFIVKIRKLRYEDDWRVNLYPIKGGYGTAFIESGKIINIIEKKVKKEIDKGIWKSYLR